MDSRNLLFHLCVKHAFDWQKVFEDLSIHPFYENYLEADVQASVDFMKAKGFNWITFIDIDYPERAKQIYMPDFVMFYEGDIKVLETIMSEQRKHYVTLCGINVFNIPSDRLITVDDKCVIHIGNDLLKIWFEPEDCLNDKSLFRVWKFAGCIGDTVLFTDRIRKNRLYMEKIADIVLQNNGQADVFVIPGGDRSVNNKLIKSGAILCDTAEDILNELD